MEYSDQQWMGEIFTHLEVLVCICWWYWSLLCLYVLNIHIVSDSYSRFSICYVDFLCNMEVSHRWCEFLKILFYKNCFSLLCELVSYSRELKKSFHYTNGVHCLLLCSMPMKALLTILLNTLCYFMANVSDMYTYSLLTYPLAGFDMTLSSSLISCQKYKWLGLHMENAAVRTCFPPSASLKFRELYI